MNRNIKLFGRKQKQKTKKNKKNGKVISPWIDFKKKGEAWFNFVSRINLWTVFLVFVKIAELQNKRTCIIIRMNSDDDSLFPIKQ